MRIGLIISLLLHLAIVGAAFLSLPPGWRPEVEPEPYIPLELIAEAELDLTTSIPAATTEPVDEPEPESEPIVEEVIEPAPSLPEEVAPEPEPEPAPTLPEPEPEPETPPPPVQKPDPKPESLDLDALSKLIDKEVEAEEQRTATDPSLTDEVAETARDAVGDGDRLSASVVAKMQSAVRPCWNAGAIIGAPRPEDLVVTLEFELTREGEIVSRPRVANALQINLSGNQFWKVAEREAIAAVTKCAPYNFLPIEQYTTWKDMRLNFDPSAMVGL